MSDYHILEPTSSRHSHTECGESKKKYHYQRKSSSDGAITVYLSKREFYDMQTSVDPIEGVLHLTEEMSKKRIFAELSGHFQYGFGRMEGLDCGVKREFFHERVQVWPVVKNESDEQQSLSMFQSRIIKRVGSVGISNNRYLAPQSSSNMCNATRNDPCVPFSFQLPLGMPSSVTLQPGEHDQKKHYGISYDLSSYWVDNDDDKPDKKHMVRFRILKLNHFSEDMSNGKGSDGTEVLPRASAEKSFLLHHNHPVKVMVELDRSVYMPGQPIKVKLHIENTSFKDVKGIHVMAKQMLQVRSDLHAPVNEYKYMLASWETSEGCPIRRGQSLDPEFTLCMNTKNHANKRFLALDGRLHSDEHTDLAPSTYRSHSMLDSTQWMIVEYVVKVHLLFSMATDLQLRVPFVFSHRIPSDGENDGIDTDDCRSSHSGYRSRRSNSDRYSGSDRDLRIPRQSSNSGSDRDFHHQRLPVDVRRHSHNVTKNGSHSSCGSEADIHRHKPFKVEA